MAKQLKFDVAARESLMKGVDKLANELRLPSVLRAVT